MASTGNSKTFRYPTSCTEPSKEMATNTTKTISRENSCDEAIILRARRVKMTMAFLRERNPETNVSDSGRGIPEGQYSQVSLGRQ